MVEGEWLSFMWHQGRLANRGEMVFTVCGMAINQATLKEIYRQENQVKAVLKGKHHSGLLGPKCLPGTTVFKLEGDWIMSGKSKIEWTDATWNPVRGCPYCYAETLAERSRGVTGHPFQFGFLLRRVHEKLLSLYAGVRQRWSSLPQWRKKG